MNLKFTLIAFILIGMTLGINAQSVIELKEKKAEVAAAKAEAQAQVDAYQAEIMSINSQLVVLGGWRKGIFGTIGLNFAGSNSWASNSNPNSSSSALNMGVNVFANSIREKDFWRNKGVITLGWQSLDTDTKDTENDGFLDDRTTDILNLSSLYGRNISDKLSISAMAELNSSVFQFLNPGSFDIGGGITYTASSDLVVVIHPLNYHLAFGGDNISTEGGLGAKVRADYTHTFSNGLAWSSTLSTFIPYVTKDPTLFEYTWLNNLSYTVWKGIGVGVSFGLRNSAFEADDGRGVTSPKSQTYYTVGISYSY